MMVLAHRPGERNWQAKTSRHLLGVGWATAPKSPAACGDLLLDTSRLSDPPPPLHPCPGALFYRLSAGLIRADMLSVLGWTDIAIAGVCVCVRCCGSLEAVRDTLCIISSSVRWVQQQMPPRPSQERSKRSYDLKHYAMQIRPLFAPAFV